MLAEVSQFAVGFIVALSGTLIPGPLLIYILAKASVSKGAWTGFYTSVGHVLVEIPIISLIVLELYLVLQNPFIVLFFGCLGGVLLVFLGMRGLLWKANAGTNPNGLPHLKLHPLLGGILFSTVLNPTVPFWWATLGFTLLMNACLTASFNGLVFWSLGHFTADIAWYTAVAYFVWSGRKAILKYQRLMVKACSLLLTFFGCYLLAKYALQSLLP